MPGEFEYIAWLRAQTPADPRVLIGPGDDCAAIATPARAVLVTTDMLMDGTDFILSEIGPRRVGRKAMAVNLSDIAAMAGTPTAAVVSVASPRSESRPTHPPPSREGESLPSPLAGEGGESSSRERGKVTRVGTRRPSSSLLSAPSPARGEGKDNPPFPSGRGTGGVDLAAELYLGLREVADAFGVALIGGDTNSWNGPLVISVTALGEATARGPVRRNGARPGDWLFVTGPLGGSILAHHLDFTPRVREALLLHEVVNLRAMLDISDGLAADLNHLCEESGCGAVLFADAIPVSDAARVLSLTSGKSPLQHALGDGEDFELVFAVSLEDGAKLLASLPIPGLAKIGECVDAGLWLESAGVRQPLAPAGWVHDLGE